MTEGDAYNRALVDRAERRLNNLDFFKSVKITAEPGSSSYRVLLVVNLEEKSTGDFSVSGGYSTSDGALAEVSVSERNFLGRGLYAKAAVLYGQYSRGITLSYVEPYLLDYRVALGLDAFYKEQLATSTTSYGTKTIGFSPRLGFTLREDLSLQLRYSIYQQQITLTDAYNNCNNNASNSLLAFNPTPAYISSVLGGSIRPIPVLLRIMDTAATRMVSSRCRFEKNWAMAPFGRPPSDTTWPTTPSTTTRTRPTVC